MSAHWTAWWETGRTGAMSHESYVAAMEQWAERGEHSGPEASEKFAEYTALNWARMKRISKTYKMGEEMKVFLESGACAGQHWVVITESWCGDAIQSGPLIARMAKTAGVTLEWVLRDGPNGIIDDFPTGGGRSIPIWIVADDQGQVLGTWGPRPATVRDKVAEYRARREPKPPYAEYAAEIQLWYARNRGREIEAEALALLKGIG